MVDLPLPHVEVELQLLWSRKELHPAHGNCTCCTDDEDIPLQKPWQLLLLHTIQCMRRAFKVDPNECKSLFTLEHLKWTQVQSQQHYLCISKWHNFRLVLICSQLSLNPSEPQHLKILKAGLAVICWYYLLVGLCCCAICNSSPTRLLKSEEAVGEI